MASVAAPDRIHAEGARQRQRRAVATPVGLWVGAVTVVASLLLFALIGVGSTERRRTAADTVASEATPLVASAENLYVALASADAAASTAFLQTGPEPVELRTRYADDIERAGRELASINHSADLSEAAAQAVAVLSAGLPKYSELIATARTNKHAGNAVGAAYQRSASKIMRDELLPATTTIYTEAVRHLDEGYHDGRGRVFERAVVVAGTTAVLVLIVVQVFLTRRTRRWLNIGLAAATVLVIGLTIWVTAGLGNQRDSLTQAQRKGSDPMLLHSIARILALRSLSDENLDLIEHGTEPAYMDDFDTMTARVGNREGTSGLLAQARDKSPDAAATTRLHSIVDLYAAYLALHDSVRALADNDLYDAAFKLATGEQAQAAGELDTALAAEVAAMRSDFDASAARASDRLDSMAIEMVIVIAIAGALALAGIWPRLREYR